ncbi:MAG TPA: acetate--CoA ligase family protein [Mycobacteriales bacterium]|nr:acetate--CoA ligase family protein [Mycobacteriales bacterium]
MLTPAAERLRRFLWPRTVAVVGANERLGMSNNAVLPMLEKGIEVGLVNPTKDRLYDRPAVATLSDLGSVDAVLALVNATRSIEVAKEAVALGCGGVVLAAGGFGEAGEGGRALQDELVRIAGEDGLPVVGPNCSGFMNVPLGINLFTGGRIRLEPGPVAIVSQSGFLVRAALAAAQQRRLGISVAVSSGNEAVTDLADYVDAFADDPATRVVCLVVEKVRDPARFFAAVARARANDTAVIALKLGRSSSSRAILQSHTGAIADESWVYDLGFAEHGVLTARDIDDLVDQAQLFAQLPVEQWRPLRSVAMITSSGGVAALATDLADGTGVDLPPLEELRPWVAERIPGAGTLNPLDMTGFAVTDAELTQELFTRYAAASGVDVLALCWWLGEDDEAWGSLLLTPYAAAATAVPRVVTPVEATGVGSWASRLREDGVCVARGVASLYRAMSAMTAHTTHTTPSAAATRELPPLDDRVPQLVGGMLGFADAMRLLEECGIAHAAFHIVAPDADDLPPNVDLGDRVVVKLADVPHRTELGAVSVGVPRGDVAAEIARLRAIAAEHAVPATVVVQEMVDGSGEVFAGLQLHTDLGPFALLGRGGVQVEAAGGVRGRSVPLSAASAEALVEEVAGPEATARIRGAATWDLGPLTALAQSLNELWRRTAGWAGSVDLNPLVVTATGPVAVDALILGAGI